MKGILHHHDEIIDAVALQRRWLVCWFHCYGM